MSTIIGTLFLLVAVNYCCYISTTLNTDDYNNNYNFQPQQQYNSVQKLETTTRSASDNDSAVLIKLQTSHVDDDDNNEEEEEEELEEDNIEGDINNYQPNNGNDNDAAALPRAFYKLRERWRSMRRQSRLSEERLLRQSIKFIYYKNNDRTHETVDDEEATEDIGECKITDKFAFILHGWRQSCEIEWMPKLVES